MSRLSDIISKASQYFFSNSDKEEMYLQEGYELAMAAIDSIGEETFIQYLYGYAPDLASERGYYLNFFDSNWNMFSISAGTDYAPFLDIPVEDTKYDDAMRVDREITSSANAFLNAIAYYVLEEGDDILSVDESTPMDTWTPSTAYNALITMIEQVQAEVNDSMFSDAQKEIAGRILMGISEYLDCYDDYKLLLHMFVLLDGTRWRGNGQGWARHMGNSIYNIGVDAKFGAYAPEPKLIARNIDLFGANPKDVEEVSKQVGMKLCSAAQQYDYDWDNDDTFINHMPMIWQ